MKLRFSAYTALVLVCGACDPAIESERGDFMLEVAGLHAPSDALWIPDWDPPYLVLPGTRMCVTLNCRACADGHSCADAPISVSGPIELDDDGCYVPTAPGEVEWSVGFPCGAPGQPPDRAGMRVVDPDHVVAEVFDDFTEVGRTLAAAEPPQGALVGAAWDDDIRWPLQIVAGTRTGLAVRLRDTGTGHGVAWEWDAGEVTWTTTAGRPPIAYPGDYFSLVAFAGTEAEARLRVGEHTWAIGQIVGVPAEAAASLDVAAIVAYGEGDVPILSAHASPLYARAFARDADGRPMIGLPVTWSVDEGEIAVLPSPAGDLVELADECLPYDERGGPREVVLRASHGDLSSTLRLQWIGLAGPPNREWTPDPNCLAPTEGCGCRSSDPPALALVVLGLLALARRRRRHVCSSLSVGTCLIMLAGAACDGGDGGDGAPSVLRAAEVHELGGLALDGLDKGGGYSIRVGERGLWLLRYGYPGAPVFLTSPDLDAFDGLHPLEVVDHDGDLRGAIPLTDDEFRYNTEHRLCGAELCPQVDVAPGPLVHDPGRSRVLIVYTKQLRRQPGAELEYIGSSLAVWSDDLQSVPLRPALGGADEPTLMFGANEPRLAAALAVDDNLYAFACGGADDHCILARAPLAEALHRNAWSFYVEPGEWRNTPARATALFAGAPANSVHHNAHADAYVAAYAVPGTASIVIRTAPRLEGPWSEAEEIHRAWQSTPAVTVDTALFHPELAQDGGRVDVLTYSADPGGVRLVEVHWE